MGVSPSTLARLKSFALVLPLALVLLVFVVAPLGVVLAVSVFRYDNFEVIPAFTFENYASVPQPLEMPSHPPRAETTEPSTDESLSPGDRNEREQMSYDTCHSPRTLTSIRSISPDISINPKDVSGAGRELSAVGQRVLLFGECPFAPVNPAVRAAVRAVQIVCATRERLAVEPDFLLVRLAVVVGVGELPDLRRRGDI